MLQRSCKYSAARFSPLTVAVRVLPREIGFFASRRLGPPHHRVRNPILGMSPEMDLPCISKPFLPSYESTRPKHRFCYRNRYKCVRATKRDYSQYAHPQKHPHRDFTGFRGTVHWNYVSCAPSRRVCATEKVRYWIVHGLGNPRLDFHGVW